MRQKLAYSNAGVSKVECPECPTTRSLDGPLGGSTIPFPPKTKNEHVISEIRILKLPLLIVLLVTRLMISSPRCHMRLNVNELKRAGARSWSEPCSSLERRSFSMETSSSPGQSMAASHSLSQVMRRHPLFLAYAFAWLPLILSQEGRPLSSFHMSHIIVFITDLALVVPMLSAFIMTNFIEGKSGSCG
jgi:hypothetical protein